MKRVLNILVWAITGKFKSDKSQFKNCTVETMWSKPKTRSPATWNSVMLVLRTHILLCFSAPFKVQEEVWASEMTAQHYDALVGFLVIKRRQCKGDFGCSKSTCERSLEQLCNLAMQCLLCALSVIWENTSEERSYNLRQTSNIINWCSRLLFQSIVGIPKIQTL